MPTKKIPFADATASQLADFATLHLGLEGVRYTNGKDNIIAKIRSVGNYDAIEIEVDEEQVGAAPPMVEFMPHPSDMSDVLVAKAKDDPEDTRPWQIIVVHEDAGVGGDRPVPVAVNGEQMLIPRGRKVKLPARYVEALEHAIRGVPVRGPNGEVTGFRPSLQYPFSKVG